MPFADSASLASLAVRRLRRSPLFALSAVLLLGVGVGLGIPLFNIINIQLLQPAAAGYHYALVSMNQRGGLLFARHEVDAVWSRPPESFAVLVGTGVQRTTAVADGVSRRLTAEGVVGPYFSEFPTVPLAGRLLTTDDEQQQRNVAVITERLQRAVFTDDVDPIGASLVLGGHRVTVVGVVSEQYQGAPTSVAALRQLDAWVPGHLVAPTQLFGRLRPGVSIEAADAELSSRPLPRHESGSPRVLGVRQGIGPALEDLSERAYIQSGVMLVVGAAISLIAAGSFSLLLFARMLSGQADLSIRLALGATAVDLTRLLAYEAGLLAAGATIVAVTVGTFLSSLFTQQVVAASGLALAPDLTPDWRLIVYTAITTFGAAWMIVAKLAWNLRSLEALGSLVATSGLGGATQRTGKQTSRLVVAQTAASTGLLLVAVMLGLATNDLARWSTDIDIERSALAWLDPSALPPDSHQSEAVVRRALDVALEAPGVIDAAVITMLPGSSRSSRGVAPGPPGTADSSRRSIYSHFISVNGLSLLGRVVLKGRMFSAEEERQNVPLAVVSATAAARLWPDIDPLGRRFRFTGRDSDGQLFTVIGVVDDSSPVPGSRQQFGELYVPFGFRPATVPVGILARTDAEGTPLAAGLRDVFRVQLPDTGFLHVRSMHDELSDQLVGATLWSRSYGTLGLLVFVVAMGGLYGLSAHLAALRQREIGIRRALGATSTMLCRMLHREHSGMLAMGTGLGCLGGLFVASLMMRFFPTLRLWDPVTIAAVGATLYVAGLAGALMPFTGAMRNPIVQLRDN